MDILITNKKDAIPILLKRIIYIKFHDRNKLKYEEIGTPQGFQFILLLIRIDLSNVESMI